MSLSRTHVASSTSFISVAITHTVYVGRLILGHIAVLRIHQYVHRWMRPIVTNLVAWSVGLSVTVAVQKRLNLSRCRLDCGFGWVEESMCYMGAHWRHLANTIEPSLCGYDAALCRITLTTCLTRCLDDCHAAC